MSLSRDPGSSLDLLAEGPGRALELARQGAQLEQVLDVLARTAETLGGGKLFASVLLLDEDGRHLRHGAAPSLPMAYCQAIDGVEIGPCVGSCGTAAYVGHAIYVTDIDRDPLWSNFRVLALQHGLRACWSTPLLSREGGVLGTLAIYYGEPRGPTQQERKIVELLVATASVVVENARLHSRLEDLARRARLAASASGFGYFTWEVETDVVLWQNDRPYEMFGIDRSEPPINARRFVSEFLHADDRAGFEASVAKALDDSGIFHFKCRIHRKGDGRLRLVEFTGEESALAGQEERRGSLASRSTSRNGRSSTREAGCGKTAAWRRV